MNDLISETLQKNITPDLGQFIQETKVYYNHVTAKPSSNVFFFFYSILNFIEVKTEETKKKVRSYLL